MDYLEKLKAIQKEAISLHADTEKPIEANIEPLEESLQGVRAIKGIEASLEALQNLNSASDLNEKPPIESPEEAIEEDTRSEIISLKNLIRFRELQEKIKSGITGKAEVESLFLDAVEAMSLLLNDKEYFNQLEEDFITVYGEGMLEAYPLQKKFNKLELEKKKLEASIKRSKAPEGTKCNLKKFKLESIRHQQEELLKLQEEGREIEAKFREPIQLTFSNCYSPEIVVDKEEAVDFSLKANYEVDIENKPIKEIIIGWKAEELEREIKALVDKYIQEAHTDKENKLIFFKRNDLEKGIVSLVAERANLLKSCNMEYLEEYYSNALDEAFKRNKEAFNSQRGITEGRKETLEEALEHLKKSYPKQIQEKARSFFNFDILQADKEETNPAIELLELYYVNDISDSLTGLTLEEIRAKVASIKSKASKMEEGEGNQAKEDKLKQIYKAVNMKQITAENYINAHLKKYGGKIGKFTVDGEEVTGIKEEPLYNLIQP